MGFSPHLHYTRLKYEFSSRRFPLRIENEFQALMDLKNNIYFNLIENKSVVKLEIIV